VLCRLGVFAAVDGVSGIRLVRASLVVGAGTLVFAPELVADLRVRPCLLVLGGRGWILARRLIAVLTGITLVRELSAGFLLRFVGSRGMRLISDLGRLHRGVQLGCLSRGVRVA